MAAVLVSIASVCGVLYWGQLVFVPLALAGLLTFLLTPVVARIERWGLPRIPAVVLVVSLTGLVLATVGWSVAVQLTSFAAELPTYKDNIKAKVADLRAMVRGGALEKVQETIDEVKRELEKEDGEGERAQKDGTADATTSPEPDAESESEEEPVPVRLAPEDYLLPDTEAITPYMRPIGVGGLVIVLAFFMLIYREDVLSRLVSLAGTRSLAVTTRALDEANRRISQYLLMQLVINAGFGLAVGTGLYLLGVPFSILWGLTAFAFRYVPYIGPWVAALLPIAVSLVHFPGWGMVLVVVGMFIGLELFTNNFVEPWLYGQSVGLSPVAVIFAAAFWTWMWGPIGLLLATPLTVCLVVLGEYVPALAIFDRLLSDQPALKPHLWLYQRLLAGDEEDAEGIVEHYLNENSPADTCDKLLLPAILVARRERAARRIDEDDVDQIREILEGIIDDLPDWNTAPQETEAADLQDSHRRPVLVIAFPLHEGDVLVLKLLQRLLKSDQCRVEILSLDMLISERIAQIEERRPAVVCVSSLPPGGWTQTRALCKALRRHCPDTKIVVGRWSARYLSDRYSAKRAEKVLRLLRENGANAAAGSLAECCDVFAPIIQFHLVNAAEADEQARQAVSA